MIRSPLRFTLLPLGLGLVALAGCGSPSAASTTTTTVSSATTPDSAATPGVSPTVQIPPTPVVTGDSAAIVNGQKIPLSRYRFLLSLSQRAAVTQTGHATPIKTLAKQIMDEVIINELVRQYAVAHHLSVGKSEIDSREKLDVTQSGSQQAFNQTLKQANVTMAQYRYLIYMNLLGAKVEQKVAPIATHKERAAQVRHILICYKGAQQCTSTRSKAQAQALAQQVLKQIQHGGDFAALAKKYSSDTGSAAQGGSLGTVYPGQMVPSFDHAVFSQKVNVPKIVLSQYGYHIVEVLSRGMAPAQPTQQDQAKQQAVFKTWITAQKKHARITQQAHVHS